MTTHHPSYNLYFKFIEKYIPSGFVDINRHDPLIKEIELLTETSNQFFFIGDLIEMKILFCSNRSAQMVGVDPENLSPYHMNQATHADELHRLGLAIANRMKIATEFGKEMNGSSVLSTNFKLKNQDGLYSDTLIQCYSFFSPVPKNTVYQLQVHTNIDWWDKTNGKLHYYIGEDISKFRFPDKELLEIGIPFSGREFRILVLLSEGCSSRQIAEKLFLSTNTVNTHRRNILNKTPHTRIQELISELKEKGIL